MSALMSKLSLYLQYPFVRHALIVGVLVALTAALLGVTLVLRRYALIGEGLSHVAFGAMAVASVMRLVSNLPLVLAVTIVTAVLLLRARANARTSGDAAIAMLSVGALAIGYLTVNLFSKSSNLTADVCTTLFGATSILTLTKTDVLLSLGLSVSVLIIFVALYAKTFAVAFDEPFARAIGLHVDTIQLIAAIVTGTVIVLGMQLVGSLLITALIVFPALSSMHLMKTFKGVTWMAALIAVVAALIGLLIAILGGTPVGSTIVVVNLIVFALVSLFGLSRRGGLA